MSEALVERLRKGAVAYHGSSGPVYAGPTGLEKEAADRIEALERELKDARSGNRYAQLEALAIKRAEAAEADKARLSEARDDWENEAGEFAKEVDRFKCVIEEMEQERNSFDTHMEAVKRKYRNRAIEAERAARAALSGSGSGWRVIETDTPPHDVPVLLWQPPSMSHPNGLIEARPFSTGRSGKGWSEYSQHSWATHWMPLPASPSTAGER